MAKPTTSEKHEAPEQEYFFSGGSEYLPVSVKARSQEEANKKWEEVRVPVEGNTQPGERAAQEE